MQVMMGSGCVSTQGDFNPLANVGQWLAHLGHEVEWLFFGGAEGTKSVYDERVRAYCSAVHYVQFQQVVQRPGAELFRNIESFRQASERSVERAPVMIEKVRAVLRRAQPDVYAGPGNLWVAFVAAHLEGVRYAGIGTGLRMLQPSAYEGPEGAALASAFMRRDQLVREAGMMPEFHADELVSPWLNVVFTTPEAAGPGANIPDRCHLVGASTAPGARGDEPPFPWEEIVSDLPLVYVSFGSGFAHPQLFARIASALEGEGVQIVVNGGAHAAELARALAPGIVVMSYVPQLQILERARVFVTHGGANSVTEALARGVPLLVCPQWLDQYLQAFLIEAHGSDSPGIVISDDAAPVDALKAALRALLDPEGSHARGARRLRASFEHKDGGRSAAELIAALDRAQR